MNIFLIYKQILDSSGYVDSIELVEIDMDENMAARFSKLYTLQVPSDLKDRISYHYTSTIVS
jgi:hypothetical protein